MANKRYVYGEDKEDALSQLGYDAYESLTEIEEAITDDLGDDEETTIYVVSVVPLRKVKVKHETKLVPQVQRKLVK